MTAETIAKALGGRKAGAAGWRAARRMTIARRAFRSGTRTTARCWCAATPAAIRSASSRRCKSAACGPITAALAFAATRRTPVEREPDQDDARRSEAALAIWQSANPAQGTPVETYLASRGIDLPPPTRCASIPV